MKRTLLRAAPGFFIVLLPMVFLWASHPVAGLAATTRSGRVKMLADPPLAGRVSVAPSAHAVRMGASLPAGAPDKIAAAKPSSTSHN